MEYLIGLLSGVGFFVVAGGFAYIGYRQGRKKITPVSKDEEEVRKADNLRKDFINLMKYDVSTALERKKV